MQYIHLHKIWTNLKGTKKTGGTSLLCEFKGINQR